MEIDVTTIGDCRRLEIRGEVNALAVRRLLAEVTAGLARCQALDLDLSGVTDMDSVGVQLLSAADTTARRKHKELWFTAPSRAVLAEMEQSELTSHLCERMRIGRWGAEASHETESWLGVTTPSD